MNPLKLARKRDGIPLLFQEAGPPVTLPARNGHRVELVTHLRSYADVVAFETDPRFSRARLRPPNARPHFLFKAPWFTDAPLHPAYRRAASGPLHGARVAGYEPMVREAAEKWVTAGTAPDVFDLTGDVLQPFALEVIGRILGAHGEEIAGFWDHLKEVTENEHLNVYPDPGPMAASLDRVIATADDGALLDFADRLSGPNAPAVFAGLERELQLGMGGSWLMAGTDTVAMTIANVFALAQRSGWWSTLRAAALNGDEAEVGVFMEEGARLLPAFPAAAAVARGDVLLPSGHTVPEGRKTVAWLMAANRDPGVFDHPDLFWPGRTGEPLTFGWGDADVNHYCWGAGLARLEMRVIVPLLFQVGIHPAGGRKRVTGRVNRLTPDPYTHRLAR
jgi:cytochrome P450